MNAQEAYGALLVVITVLGLFSAVIVILIALALANAPEFPEDDGETM